MRNDLAFNQLTSVGDRELNQDYMAHIITDDYALFVVADGLGGHHAGEKASQYFCQSMIKLAPKYQALLQKSKKHAHAIFSKWMTATVNEMVVLFEGDAEAVNSYTTCVVLYLDDDITVTVHCGDSRVYRLNQRQVLWRTRDHSLIQKQLNEGVITEREMGMHPEQNQLTRSINIRQDHQAEINIYPAVNKDETFILCTDGFWEFIKEKDLLQLSSRECDVDKLKKIAKMMHLRGEGRADNLTVQWVRAL